MTTTPTPTPTATRLSDLTVVIPNWNTPDLTIRCVEALVAEGVPPGRIVLVENGSTDDSYERLQSALPECQLIRFEENVGYGRAMNAGARELQGTAYLLMNNDAFVHGPGSVERLLATLDDPSVGLGFPRYLNVDLTLQPSVMPTHSPLTALVRASGLSRFVPNKWAPKLSTHWDHAQSREIEGANGAVMLFRGQTWEQLGGFDERIYIYAEEIDICWRTRKLGWQIWFTPEAEFMHIGGGSIGKQWSDATRERLIAVSESRVIRWHLPRASAAATVGLISTGIAMRWLAYSLVRNKEAAAAYRASLGGFLSRTGQTRP
jgi:GT2 family glycosyltransferase